MNCDVVRHGLARCFDLGELPEAAIQAHLNGCVACQAYQARLDGLDGLLRSPAPLEDDGALVARIQAAVAKELPPESLPAWAGMAIVAAVVLLALGGGWLLDGYGHVPSAIVTNLRPSAPLLPDWGMVRREVVGVPMEIHHEATVLLAQGGSVFRTVTTWVQGTLGGNGFLLWGGVIVGLLVVLMIDSRERRRTS